MVSTQLFTLGIEFNSEISKIQMLRGEGSSRTFRLTYTHYIYICFIYTIYILYIYFIYTIYTLYILYIYYIHIYVYIYKVNNYQGSTI